MAIYIHYKILTKKTCIEIIIARTYLSIDKMIKIGLEIS